MQRKKPPIAIQTFSEIIRKNYYYALFAGKKDLFTALAIEHNWNWSRQYPVIH